MNLDELYKVYGELMVKNEILQNQINQVKGQISEKLNTLPPQPEEKSKQEEESDTKK